MRCLSTNSWLYLPSNTRNYIRRVGKYSETHHGLTGSIFPKRFTISKLIQIIENTWDFFLEWKILHIRVHVVWHSLRTMAVGQDSIPSYRFFEI